MIKKALLLASVLCVEPYSHVTIEITEDYASSNDSFDLGFTPEEDVRAPSRSVVDLDDSIMGVSGVTVLKKYGEEGDE